MKINSIFFILVLLSGSMTAQTKQIRQIDSLMQTAYRRGVFNGNILVVQHNKTIYEKSFGFANGNKTIPLQKENKFDIGSISKEFNGAAIMVLEEKGKLSLEDNLRRFFPEFPDWADQVKIKHLINYTSGIPVLGPAADGTDSLIYQSLLSLKTLSAAPGTVYIYNHINVSLQRRIIEKLSGLSYAEFVKRYLFKPAGMKNAIVDYPVTAKGMARAFDNEGNDVPYLQATNGWVRLPVEDLYKWIRALHAHKIINAVSLKKLGENFPGGESSLGTTVFSKDSLLWHQHQGSNSNYEAAFYSQAADNITIVMMTNNQQMKVWPIKTAILNILKEEPFIIPKKSLYLSIRDKMLSNVEEGMDYYKTLKANGTEDYDFSFEIGDLISTGKYLLRRDKFDAAITVFQTAVELKAKEQDISYGYELLGDTYRKKGDKPAAIASYSKALSIFPGNKNAAGVLKELTEKSGEQ